jgi:hypothetical protein
MNKDIVVGIRIPRPAYHETEHLTFPLLTAIDPHPAWPLNVVFFMRI